jgi:hypothetical protein
VSKTGRENKEEIKKRVYGEKSPSTEKGESRSRKKMAERAVKRERRSKNEYEKGE